MDYLLVLLGLVLLIVGGDVLVRGALGLSTRLGIASAIVGAVVMGFGTSAPELATSVMAALSDAPGIALGNVIGSNVANIPLILGVTALVTPVVARIGRVEGAFFALATLAIIAVLFIGGIGLTLGLVFLAILVAFLWASIKFGQVDVPVEAEGTGTGSGIGLSVGLVAVGLVVLIGGAQALVSGAISIAATFGVRSSVIGHRSSVIGHRSSVIGLKVVAVGTSLPELSASLSAAWHRQGAMALGNIVGSNIFNVFGILGVAALVRPFAVPPSLDMTEVFALLVTGAALLALGWMGRIGRIAGGVGVFGYAVYVVSLIS